MLSHNAITASRRFIFSCFICVSPIQSKRLCIFGLLGLLWIYYLDYFGSSHARFSIYKRSFLKSFDPKSGFSFLREIFFLNFVRCEKSCFSVTLPQFSGDLTCLHCLLRHVCMNTVLFQIQSKYSYCSR